MATSAKDRKVLISCTHCKKQFERNKYAYDFSVRQGKKEFFCCPSHAGFYRAELPDEEKLARKLGVFHTTLNCFYCSKSFKKPTRVYEAASEKAKAEGRFYCSHSCVAFQRNKDNLEKTNGDYFSVKNQERVFSCAVCNKKEVKKIDWKLYHNLKSITWTYTCSTSCRATHMHRAQPRETEFSIWNRIARNGKQHDKRTDKKNNVTGVYLKGLWDKQKGICPLTGWKMKLPKWDRGFFFEERARDNVSVDRIDNSKGHEVGNVQLVCLFANYAKNNFTDQDLSDFCHAFVKNQNDHGKK